MKFLEKNLEQIIFEANNDLLQEKGLHIAGKKIRQLRIGNYGIADLVTFERNYINDWHNHSITITVYELKKENINISTFLQALGYLRGIQRYIDNFRNTFSECYINYGIVCIGKNIDLSSTYIYMSDFLKSENFTLKNYIYDYEINGIIFKDQERFSLINEGFVPTKGPF